MITADTITVEQLAALAKSKAATCMRAGGGRLSADVAKLTYLVVKRVSRPVMADLTEQGLIRWDNGTVITEAGDALLAQILNARAASRAGV